MGLGVGGHFGEPGAGNHDAGGSDRVAIERVEAGTVFGVGYSEVVGVNDEEFGIARIAESLGNGLGLCRSIGQGREQEQDCEYEIA